MNALKRLTKPSYRNKDNKNSGQQGALIQIRKVNQKFQAQPDVLQMLYLLRRIHISLQMLEIQEQPCPEENNAYNFLSTTNLNLSSKEPEYKKLEVRSWWAG